MMTTESALDGGSTPVGLIIAIPLFLAVNALLAVVGARWMNRLSHDSSEDVLTLIISEADPLGHGSHWGLHLPLCSLDSLLLVFQMIR